MGSAQSVDLVSIGEYEYLKRTENLLGRGSFGEVWKGCHKVNKTSVAVKRITGIDAAAREIKLLESVVHDNLVRVHAWSRDDICVHIVMEFCSMDLEKLLERVGKFAGLDMQLVVQQLARGYNALYNNKILHRDIKPGNILVSYISSTDVVLKLADFGCSKMMLDTKYASSKVGTPRYMAPEVGAIVYMNAKCHYDYRADLWSMGMVFNQCCGGQLMERHQMMQLFRMAAANNPELASATTCTIAPEIDAELHTIIAGFLKPRYVDRMSPMEFFNHSFVRVGVDKRGITLAAKRIFVVGGRCAPGGDAFLKSIDAFDFASRTWRLVAAELPGPKRASLAVVAFRGRLYAFGGFGEEADGDRVDVYDHVHSSWSSATNMLTPRRGHSAAVLRNDLIVVGGLNRGATLSSVDAFDPLRNEWTAMASMATKRRRFAVAVLGSELYAIGGDEADAGTEFKPLSSVEKFDGVRWSPVASMMNHRFGHCAAAVSDTIFVFGGANENDELLSSVESFSLSSGEWRMHDWSLMPVGRQGASAIAYEGRIYIFGGWGGAAYLDTMDVFDPTSNKWETIAARMTTPRGIAGNALV